jgi:hypothetical protein
VLLHPDISGDLVSKPCLSFAEADQLREEAQGHAGFTRGRVEEWLGSGIGWRECGPPDEAEESNPDWNREALFEHARQTGQA